MKKIYLSLLTAVSALSLQAQLTQANHAPLPTYTFALYHCDSVNVNPGLSGANVSWNFASINTFSNLVSNYSELAVSGNTAYPNADVAVAASANNTSYYHSTANNLSYYGGNLAIGSISGSLTYTNAAIVAAYPMTLNTTTTSGIAGNIVVNAPPVSGTFAGSCVVTADGSGTLILPGSNATFTNALRVMTSQTLNITTSFATGTVNQVVYDYYSIGIRNPIFTITTATINVPLLGNPSTQTTVTRDRNAVAAPTNTIVTGISENAARAAGINVFPNPSSTTVQFTSESPDAKQVSVYDITGKIIAKQLFTDGKAKLDVSDLNSGLYIYAITDNGNNSIKTGKLTVNH